MPFTISTGFKSKSHERQRQFPIMHHGPPTISSLILASIARGWFLICVSNLTVHNLFHILSSSTAALVAKKTKDREQLIVFDFTLWDLEQAACDGCSFCEWILEANDKKRQRDILVRKLENLENRVTRNELYDTLVWTVWPYNRSDEGIPPRPTTTTP
jgi:hypothetical protein